MKNNRKLLLAAMVAAMAVGNTAMADEVKNLDKTSKKVPAPIESSKDSTITKPEDNGEISKTVKNRNVMLNAENSTGPRNINIGLPFQGDICIMENNLPVVYNFYPTSPLLAWRNDNTLGAMGLLSYAESAVKTGKVGYAVVSNDRWSARKFHGYLSVYANHFGSSRYDLCMTGPLSKKGWGYTIGVYKSFDRANGYNYHYTPWQDDSFGFKFGIDKKYKNGRIRIFYHLLSSKQQYGGNYQPLIYEGDGKTKSLDEFPMSKYAYLQTNGLVPYYDLYTKEAKSIDLSKSKYSRAQTHSFYIEGDHNFRGGALNKWKLEYNLMYSYNQTPFSSLFPVTLMAKMPDQQTTNGMQEIYTYQGTNKQFNGSVGYIAASVIPQSYNNYIAARAELTKKVKRHDWRFGFNFQNNTRKYNSYSSMYVLSIEKNPQVLDLSLNTPAGLYQMTNKENGALPVTYSGGYGSRLDDRATKIALYGSDDWKITGRWNLFYGARVEYQDRGDNHFAIGHKANNSVYQTLSDCERIKKSFNNINYVFSLSTVYKLTSKFGFMGEATYNSWGDCIWDYETRDGHNNPMEDSEGWIRQTKFSTFRNNVLNLGAGVYFNWGNKLSLVSKLTYITKDNVRYNNATITNPANTSERQDCGPIYYDIKTLGWTTDIVTNPFKNFNLHFLFTWQNPQYKNLKYEAFNVVYDYNNNNIAGLSKILMEIDPSYTFMQNKLKLWVSLRYFGKQYENATNAFYYNGWWETFGGIDYTISRNVNLKLQVVNFLGQNGVKGEVQGGDQVKDATPYFGRIIMASCIRPTTVELTANIKF